MGRILTALVLAGLVLAADTFARTTCTLTGRITDAETGRPLEGGCVFIRDTYLGGSADHDGRYILNGIAPGTYSLTVSMLGYETLSGIRVTFSEGEIVERDFALHRTVLVGEEVTVTATRGSSLIMDVPTSVDVIDTRILERENPQNLAEVLDNVQGVFIKDYGGIGGTKTISLRGSSAEQVLVLIDGQRLNNPQTGQVDFSALSMEGIERIEVV
ncbi:MAG TPA: hypothetical protein ENI92_07830, partial [Bacteroidetes bacterium]|nr:hypothetical protein [Bacteroidota bacterium]